MAGKAIGAVIGAVPGVAVLAITTLVRVRNPSKLRAETSLLSGKRMHSMSKHEMHLEVIGSEYRCMQISNTLRLHVRGQEQVRQCRTWRQEPSGPLVKSSWANVDWYVALAFTASYQPECFKSTAV